MRLPNKPFNETPFSCLESLLSRVPRIVKSVIVMSKVKKAEEEKKKKEYYAKKEKKAKEVKKK